MESATEATPENDELRSRILKAQAIVEDQLEAPYPEHVAESDAEKVGSGETVRKGNAQAVRIHNDLGKEGFAATHDSPIKHEGKFDWVSARTKVKVRVTQRSAQAHTGPVMQR